MPADLKRANRAARLLDDVFTLPGTRIRFGWDAIVGLVPGVGELLGSIFSLFIVHEALQAGVPTSVVVRMAMNLGLDALIGAVPVLGDIFDVVFKANRRNARLLESYLDRPRQTQRRSRGWVAAVLIAMGFTLMSIVYFVVSGVIWLVEKL